MTWPEMLFFQACKLILLGNISVNSSSRLSFFLKYFTFLIFLEVLIFCGSFYIVCLKCGYRYSVD